MPPKLLKPHTSEWFAKLAASTDQKSVLLATMASANIEKLHRTDICSICGDDPAPPMKLGALTARLCEDCHRIRILMYGDLFEPMEEPVDNIEP